MDDRQIDQFNAQLRANPEYQAFLRSLGVDPSRPIRLSDSQRKHAEQWVRQHVGNIGDLEIDPAGNVNQNEGFGEQAKKWGPLVGAGAAAAFGVPGLFPGLLTGGGAAGAAGAASSALPSSAIPGMHAAIPGALAGGGGASAGIGGAIASGAGAAAPSFGRRLLGGAMDAFTDPRTLFGIASAVPQLTGAFGGGDDGESALLDEARQGMALQRRRLEQTQPVFDTLVRMAYGSAPTRHRGAAPEGYTESPGPQGPYRYQSPRFGG